MTVITCTWRSWRAAQNMQQSFRLRSCMRFEKTGQRNRLFSRASAYRGDFAPNRTQSPDQDTLKDGCEETKRIDSIYEGRTHYNTVHQQANAVFSSSIEVPKPNRGLYADLLSGNHDGHIPHYFTILTARSSDFTSNQIFPIRKASLSRHKTPLLLVLLSTAHTHLLKDTDVLVPPLIRQCFVGLEAERAIDVVCAVIDLVPYRPGLHKAHQVIDTRSRGMGAHGISVLVIESEAAVPDLWSTPGLNQRAQKTDQPEAATVAFRFRYSPGSRARALRPNVDYPCAHDISHIVQLPLANTVFHNGQRSTMLAERWLVAEGSSAETRIHRTRAKKLNHQFVDMADVDRSREYRRGRYSENIGITTKLKPITPPRVVDAAIGNILRRFRMANDVEESMPASQELEKAITAMNAEPGATPQAIAVWASVTPRENWVSQPRIPNVKMDRALASGTRYHRVLSGGGGWGNKQGLLALDPDYKLQMPENEMDFQGRRGIDIGAAHTEALEQIVKPGDVVVFFVHVAHNKNLFGTGVPPRLLHSYQILGPPFIALGTMSSSADNMDPLASSSPPDGEGASQRDPAYIFMQDYFGALSECGIRVQMNLHSANGTSEIGAQRTGTIVETKLDIPGTMFTHGHHAPVKMLSLSGKRTIINETIRGLPESISPDQW